MDYNLKDKCLSAPIERLQIRNVIYGGTLTAGL